MRRVVPALMPALVLLSACVVAGPPPGRPAPPAADTCGADALSGLVGRPDTVLDTVRLAGPVRVIRPGMAVTMDYSAERLNIEVDARKVITRVYCG